MTVTQEKVNDLKSKVVIDLKKEDLEPKVNAELKKVSKTVSLKGFRPGNAPIGLVKKMYGNNILFEELNKVLNDEVHKFIEENQLNILAQPIPAEGQSLNMDINNIKDVNFAFEIGHAPDFSLSYLDNAAAFNKYKIEVTETMLDEEVERIRKRFAKYEYPETIEEKDILTLSIEELNEAGAVKEGGINTTASVLVELAKPEHKAQFLNLKKQDAFEGNVFELFDRDREGVAKHILNVADLSTLDAIGDKFKLTLNNITRALPADLNEDFFQKAFGENGAKTEAEMRDNIRKDLDNYFEGRTDVLLVNDLYRGIMENVNFPLPEDFLKRWIKINNEQEVTDEQIENDFPAFAKQLRWQLITARISREQNFEVTNEELEERVRLQTIQQLYSYGLKNFGEDWVEGFVQKQLKDKEYVRKTHDQLLDDKVFGYIKSKVSLLEQLISLETFNEMVQKANEASNPQ